MKESFREQVPITAAISGHWPLGTLVFLHAFNVDNVLRTLFFLTVCSVLYNMMFLTFVILFLDFTMEVFREPKMVLRSKRRMSFFKRANVRKPLIRPR